MPAIHVQLLQGYDSQTKDRLKHDLTAALTAIIPADPAGVTCWLNEFPSENYARGGVARKPAAASSLNPASIAAQYLGAMQQRDLVLAKTFLGPGFRARFPGSEWLPSVEDIVAFARGRYQTISKHDMETEVSVRLGQQTVWTRGTLSGVFNDGTEFSGVRFVDRFLIKSGLIVEQEVWNELGEVMK